MLSSAFERRIERRLEHFRCESLPPTQGLSRGVREVVELIHDQLFEPELSVKYLRRRCRLRNNNFSSRFRWELGEGPREYIENRRMDAAVLLLQESSLNVFDLAMVLGYVHAETFYRAFQRRWGCTPAVLRQRSQHF